MRDDTSTSHPLILPFVDFWVDANPLNFLERHFLRGWLPDSPNQTLDVITCLPPARDFHSCHSLCAACSTLVCDVLCLSEFSGGPGLHCITATCLHCGAHCYAPCLLSLPIPHVILFTGVATINSQNAHRQCFGWAIHQPFPFYSCLPFPPSDRPPYPSYFLYEPGGWVGWSRSLLRTHRAAPVALQHSHCISLWEFILLSSLPVCTKTCLLAMPFFGSMHMPLSVLMTLWLAGSDLCLALPFLMEWI